MVVWAWLEHQITSIAAASGTNGSGATATVSGIWGAAGGRWNVGVAVGVTAMAGIALAATIVISSRKGSLKSPWSRRKRKRPLTQHQWESLFAPDGKLQDGGVKFLKKVRSGGVEHGIRSIVWPFLLGVYDLNSSEAERNVARVDKRKDYQQLRSCHLVLKPDDGKATGITRAPKEKISGFSDEIKHLSSNNRSGACSPTTGNQPDDNFDKPLSEKVSDSYKHDGKVTDVAWDHKEETSSSSGEIDHLSSNKKLGVSPPTNESQLDDDFEKSLVENDVCDKEEIYNFIGEIEKVTDVGWDHKEETSSSSGEIEHLSSNKKLGVSPPTDESQLDDDFEKSLVENDVCDKEEIYNFIGETENHFSDNRLGVSSRAYNSQLDDIEKPLADKVFDSYTNIADIDEKSAVTHVANSDANAESSNSDSSVDGGFESRVLVALAGDDTAVSTVEDDVLDGVDEAEVTEDDQEYPRMNSLEDPVVSTRKPEDFVTWQRIIRLDAIRANDEWVSYSPKQAQVTLDEATQRAEAVGLKDYDHLDACRIYHAARLVAILEAYAVYDQEVGYCQGMSDLLAPIIAVIEEDYEAFWCFVGFMKKARHNFRLDEVGIRRQLNIVAKIIKSKDSHLYKHLQQLQAEDCFFVYRMVVVLFRRELDFEQTMNLWEALWADQAALRAGFNKSGWGKIRMRAPPTEDLLLYAIAASVLQKRKLIIERFSSMEDIMKECNNMTGTLNVWKLLDDAHDLVVSLHDRL